MDPLATRPASSGRTMASSTTSTRARSRPRCSACRPPPSPGRRFDHQQLALAAVHRAAPPPGEAKTDTAILAGLFHRLRLCQRGGRRLPRADPQPDTGLQRPGASRRVGAGKEYNGRAGGHARTRGGSSVARRAAQRLRRAARGRFDVLRLLDLLGRRTEQGNMMDRRDNSDPYDIGVTLGLGLGRR